MAEIISVRGKTPRIDSSCWLAHNATIVGDVELAANCTAWFNSVIRGDVCGITVGEKTNIQDGVVIHGTYNKSNTVIGAQVSIGHGAVIHGCEIRDRVLVGMKAVIMDHAIVESNVIVAAGAVVLEKAHLKSGYIYGGVPAKIIKEIDPEQTEFFINRTAEAYLKYASWYTPDAEE